MGAGCLDRVLEIACCKVLMPVRGPPLPNTALFLLWSTLLPLCWPALSLKPVMITPCASVGPAAVGPERVFMWAAFCQGVFFSFLDVKDKVHSSFQLLCLKIVA